MTAEVDGLELLVVGSGRSGTGYVARTLTAAGFPCSHEGRWSPAGVVDPRPAESSWLAVPHLDEVPDEVPVVLVWRDPVAVVRSFVGLRFWSTPSRYRSAALGWQPDLAELDEVSASLEWWSRTNLRALGSATVVVNVDAPQWWKIAAVAPVTAAALEAAAGEVGTNVNARRRADVSLDEARPSSRHVAETVAELLDARTLLP